MYQSLPKGGEGDGFSLIEVMVATGILVVGMMAAALLMTTVYQQSARSRYMSMAATFASEKLEDLERWTPTDPNVSFPVGSTTVGSLTADTTANVGGGTVYYYDFVGMSTANGTFTETIGSAGNYKTTIQDPDGHIDPTSTAAPVSSTFERRWTIEKDQPVAGVRRITVLVTLLDNTVQPIVTFQMSAVRP